MTSGKEFFLMNPLSWQNRILLSPFTYNLTRSQFPKLLDATSASIRIIIDNIHRRPPSLYPSPMTASTASTTRNPFTVTILFIQKVTASYTEKAPLLYFFLYIA